MVVEIVLCVARCLALNHAYAEFWRSGHCASAVTKCMVVNNDPSGETGRHWFIVFLETLPAEGRGVDTSPCSQSMSPMQPNTAANKKDRSPNHQAATWLDNAGRGEQEAQTSNASRSDESETVQCQALEAPSSSKELQPKRS
jgi:hypothetical protein